MRKLALLLLLLAGFVAAAWLALRPPRADPVDARAGVQVVEELAPNADALLDAGDALEMTADDDAREPVVVEARDGARAATSKGATVRTLEPDQHWARIRVLDAETGKPIERFGARVARRVSSAEKLEGALSTRITPARHEDGRADVAARSIEEVLQIEAPGYAPSEEPLFASDLAGELQTVELTRGGSVAGRAMLGDVPAKSVRVRLQRTELLGPKETEAFDLTRFIGRPRSLSTEPDGVFVFEDLALGTYALDLRRSNGARALVEQIEVTSVERLELGDVQITPGATLRGRVLLPTPTGAESVRVFVDASGRSRTIRLDDSGTFTIDDRPGHFKVDVREQPGVLAAGAPFEFELAAGATREVVLDVRDRGGMWIEARVRSGGQPFEGARLESVDMQGSAQPSFAGAIRTGATWRWWQAQTQRVSVRVNSTNAMPLGDYAREVVPLNGEGLVELDLELAELSVDWSQITQPSFDFDYCAVNVVALRAPPLAGRKRVYMHERSESALETFAHREVDLGPIVADRVEVTLQFGGVISSDGDGQLVRLGNDKVEFRRTLGLRAGEHAVCRFTDADLVR